MTAKERLDQWEQDAERETRDAILFLALDLIGRLGAVAADFSAKTLTVLKLNAEEKAKRRRELRHFAQTND